MTQVHLICGKVGAGKSKYARELADQEHAMLLSLDEWTIHLYDHPQSREVFDDHVTRCTELMLRLAERLIPLETPAVLDFGFWKRATRDEARQRFQAVGGIPILHFLNVPANERWRRLQARNHEGDDMTYEIDREMFELFETWFEDPADDEEPLTVVVS